MPLPNAACPNRDSALTSQPAAQAHHAALGRLLHQRARTVDQIDVHARAFDEFVESVAFVATDDEHDPEGHTIAFERQQVASLLREARSHLIDVERAIARIEAGTYGSCESCSHPIASERLAALPATRICIDCAS